MVKYKNIKKIILLMAGFFPKSKILKAIILNIFQHSKLCISARPCNVLYFFLLMIVSFTKIIFFLFIRKQNWRLVVNKKEWRNTGGKLLKEKGRGCCKNTRPNFLVSYLRWIFPIPLVFCYCVF